MTTESVLDLLGALALVAGSLFAFAAAVGLVRFPDPMTRMHAATKPAVFGLLLVLLGVALSLRDLAVFSLLSLAVLVQVMSAPVSGHLVSRMAHRSGQWAADLTVVDELSRDLASGAGPESRLSGSGEDGGAVLPEDQRDDGGQQEGDDQQVDPHPQP